MYKLPIALAAMVAAGAANAATVSYDKSVPTTGTDWIETLLMPQFDSSLGSLNSVSLQLDGVVTGEARGERVGTNLSFPTRNMTFTLRSDISTTVAGVTGLDLAITPLASRTFAAGVFDGVQDFGGTSGVTYDDLAGTDTKTVTLTSSLAPFIGTGDFAAFVIAEGNSGYLGTSNSVVEFDTFASSVLTVTYDYDIASVPLPAGLPLLLAGLGGLALVRRRR